MMSSSASVSSRPARMRRTFTSRFARTRATRGGFGCLGNGYGTGDSFKISRVACNTCLAMPSDHFPVVSHVLSHVSTSIAL